MALYRYFKTVDVLPTPNGSLSTSVSPVTGRRGVVNYYSGRADPKINTIGILAFFA